MLVVDVGEAGLAHQPPRRARAEQHGVLVERAAEHCEPRQRVERIVLDQAGDAAGPHHAAHLGKEAGPGVRRHVVQHAAGEGEVEGAVGIGQTRRLVGGVVHAGPLALRPLDRFLGDVAAGDAVEDAVEIGMQ